MRSCRTIVAGLAAALAIAAVPIAQASPVDRAGEHRFRARPRAATTATTTTTDRPGFLKQSLTGVLPRSQPDRPGLSQ
jgi:hypothetical protein